MASFTSGKWIPDLAATMPPADAALRVLTARLEAVRDYLGLALRAPDKDTEYVHQLRVGTRRAGAALDIFRSCLPEKVYTQARKQLRRLRRAAGAARDWDVFLLHLTADTGKKPTRHRAGLDFLIGYAHGQRQAAQAALQAADPEHPLAFERLVARVLEAVQAPDEPAEALIDLARPALADFFEELEAAAARDLDDYDNLHQVRIAGKRLRYAMEVFADCFDPAFREVHYPAVEEMQEILGRANDSHVAAGRLRGLGKKLQETLPDGWKRYRAGVEGLARVHERRLPEERRRFEEWWRRWEKSGGESAFAALLRVPEPAGPVAGSPQR